MKKLLNIILIVSLSTVSLFAKSKSQEFREKLKEVCNKSGKETMIQLKEKHKSNLFFLSDRQKKKVLRIVNEEINNCQKKSL